MAQSRRSQRKLETEARIMSAAVRVFSQNGYSASTMDAIAQEAGLSKPTLYQYVASKEELFSAMLEAPRDMMLDVFDRDQTGGFVNQLHAFAWRYADVVMDPDLLSLARLVIGEAQRFPEIGRAYQSSGPDQVLTRLVAFMEHQKQAGHLSFEDAELAAQDFWGLILSGPRNMALHDPENIPDGAAIAQSIHNGLYVFLKAYATQPEHDCSVLHRVIAASSRP